VAFMSVATNLVPGDTNNTSDVFVRDRVTGTTERVSVDSAGNQANAGSGDPGISADGRYVGSILAHRISCPATPTALATSSCTIGAPGSPGASNVASNGQQSNGFSYTQGSGAIISANGRYVTFHSGATTLVPGDDIEAVNLRPQAFVHDCVTGITERVSVDRDGVPGNDGSYGPVVSADGSHVAFFSYATNLVAAADTNGDADVFVRRVDHTDNASDLTGDATLDDVVLEVVDGITGAVTPSVPLVPCRLPRARPRSYAPSPAGRRPRSPGVRWVRVPGRISLNGDTDATDDVVHLWAAAGGVANLRLCGHRGRAVGDGRRGARFGGGAG